MKFRGRILITGTRLETAVSTAKHSVGGQSNRQKVGGIFARRLEKSAPLQKTVKDPCGLCALGRRGGSVANPKLARRSIRRRRLTETAFGRKTRNHRALNEKSFCDRNYNHTLAATPEPPMLELFALPEAPGTHAMAKQLFGTDGIRGIPGEYPLDDSTLIRVGLALGDFLRTRGARARVLIGRDTRESGPHNAERIARGLETAGAARVSAGVLTTPGVAWLVHREGFAAGVVIAASHNPYHDNGVKLISSSGMKFPDSVEAGLEKFILSSDGSTPVATAMRLDGDEKLHEDYLEGLR